MVVLGVAAAAFVVMRCVEIVALTVAMCETSLWAARAQQVEHTGTESTGDDSLWKMTQAVLMVLVGLCQTQTVLLLLLLMLRPRKGTAVWEDLL